MTERVFYDNSSLKDLKTGGDRFWFYKNYLKWQGSGSAIYFDFGTCWHGVQDVLWPAIFTGDLTDAQLHELACEVFRVKWKELNLPLDWSDDEEVWEKLRPRTPDVAFNMLGEYISQRTKWIRDCDSLDSIEQPFAVKLWEDKEIYLTGRIDKTVTRNGERLVIDHKTTTSFDSHWGIRYNTIAGFRVDGQLKGYAYAKTLEDPSSPVLRGFIDISLIHRNKNLKTSRFDVHQLIPQTLGVERLEQWLLDTRQLILRLEAEKEKHLNGEHAFPRGCGSCSTFRECLYADLCESGFTTQQIANLEIPENMVYNEWSPVEFLQDGDLTLALEN